MEDINYESKRKVITYHFVGNIRDYPSIWNPLTELTLTIMTLTGLKERLSKRTKHPNILVHGTKYL